MVSSLFLLCCATPLDLDGDSAIQTLPLQPQPYFAADNRCVPRCAMIYDAHPWASQGLGRWKNSVRCVPEEQATPLEVLNQWEARTLLAMARTLFPHDFLADDYYMIVVAALDGKANSDAIERCRVCAGGGSGAARGVAPMGSENLAGHGTDALPA